MAKRITHELFVAVWQGSASPADAAGTLSRTVAEVMAWATWLRKKGVRLKHMAHRGRPVRLPRGQVMVTRFVQASAVGLKGPGQAQGLELVPGQLLEAAGAAGYYYLGGVLLRLPRRVTTRWVLE